MQGPILNPAEQGAPMEQDTSVSHAWHFSFTKAFYLQKRCTGCRQGRSDLHLPTQAVIHGWCLFIVAAVWSGRLCSALSHVLHTPARGSLWSDRADFLPPGTTLALVWRRDLRDAVTWAKGSAFPLLLTQFPCRISKRSSFLSWMYVW